LLRKRLKGIQGLTLAKGAGAALLATLVMGAALVGWMQMMQSHSAALTTLGGVVGGGAVYAAVLVALRLPEVRSLVEMVKRRLQH